MNPDPTLVRFEYLAIMEAIRKFEEREPLNEEDYKCLDKVLANEWLYIYDNILSDAEQRIVEARDGDLE